MKIITCQDLTKRYRENKINNTEIIVIDNISLKVKSGEFLIITGPSGSGKTTFLYLLSGLEKPTSGQVFFKQKDIFLMSKQETLNFRKNEIGFVFQNYNLIPTLNVFDNVALPLLIKNEKIKTEKINKILELTGIIDKALNYPEELSGGMQQRVAIARSLIHGPSVVFADEPTGNLDKAKGEEIMNLFQKINRELKTTIILVTHNLNHLRYATRVIELADARIIKDEQYE